MTFSRWNSSALEHNRSSSGEQLLLKFDTLDLELQAYILNLPSHISGAQQKERLHKILTNLEFIQAKIKKLRCQSLIADFALSRESDLKSIAATIVVSAHILDYDPLQLITQLSGRLPSNELADKLLREANPSFPHLRMNSRTLLPSNSGLLRTLTGHMDVIVGLAITPDLQKVISASWDKTLRVWDIASGQEVATLHNTNTYCHCAAISHDGGHIVAGRDDGNLEIWNLNRGILERTINAHDRSVQDVAISPSGHSIFSASSDGLIKQWHFETGILLATLRGHTNGVNSIKVTSSSLLISGSWDNTAIIWDLANDEARRLTGHLSGIRGVAIAPNERFMATGSNDRTVRLWELPSGNEICELASGQNYKVTSVAIMPDNRRVVSGSEDGKIRVWDVEKQQLLLTLEGHTSAIYDLKAIDNDRIITASEDQTLRVWSLAESEPSSKSPHDTYVGAVSLTRYGQAISVASPLIGYDEERICKVWNATTGNELKSFWGLPPMVLRICFIDDRPASLIAIISSEKEPQIWKCADGEFKSKLEFENVSNISDAFFLQNNSQFIAISDKGLLFWEIDAPSSLTITPFQSDDSRIFGHMAVNRSETLAVSTFMTSNTITVWSISERRIIAEFQHDGVLDAIFGSDGTIVSASEEYLQFWDLSSESQVGVAEIEYRLDEYMENIGTKIQLTSGEDGQYIFLVVHDLTLRVIDTIQRKQIAAVTFDYPLTCCEVCNQLDSKEMLVSVGDASGRVHFLTFAGA